MAHSVSTTKKLSYLPIIGLIVAAGVVVSGCARDRAPDYQKTQAANPLEVPPDLESVPPNPSTTIPGGTVSASGQQEAKDFQTFEKFEKWAEFEEFLKWKEQQGNQQADFEEFLEFKRQAGSSAPTPPDETEAGTYATLEVGLGDHSRLRIDNDSVENVWEKIGQAVAQTGSKIRKKSRKKGTFVIVPHADSSMTQKFKSFFKTPANALDIAVSAATEAAIVEVTPASSDYWTDADDFVRQLHRILNSMALDTPS